MAKIELSNLSFCYDKYSKALDNVSFTINDNEIVGIVGSTGSGKSTLIQHFNALIRLQEGKLIIDDIDLSKKKPDLQSLRKKVGMLFQYPEYQLFAETVREDVMFGPLNFGFSKEDAEEHARQAISLVGLDWDTIKERSPLELSGGQKRRVAIAGVIAYNPDYLILDEPTAGLDPLGKKEMLDTITYLKESGSIKTVIMVSHNMDEIASYTNRVIALHNSKLIMDSTPENFFYNVNVEELGLALPHVVNIVKKLNEKNFNLPENILTKDALSSAILTKLKEKKS